MCGQVGPQIFSSRFAGFSCCFPTTSVRISDFHKYIPQSSSVVHVVFKILTFTLIV